jgi:ubiquinol-cytochrome c reductase iron-sulfur subunit
MATNTQATTAGAHTADGHDPDGHTRRDFLPIMAGAWAVVGGATALWPMIDQMNPDANTRALASIEVDLAPIKPGQAITVNWQGKALFVRHRTPEEIEKAKNTPLDELKDTTAQNVALPDSADAKDENRVKPGKAEWLVLVGICTHLGCIPKGQAPGDVKGEYGGWFCPCHGSQYDTSGRIRKGPAPLNLQVPPYAFLSDTKIKIG